MKGRTGLSRPAFFVGAASLRFGRSSENLTALGRPGAENTGGEPRKSQQFKLLPASILRFYKN